MEVLAFLILFLILLIYIRKTNELSVKVEKMASELHGLRNASGSIKPATPKTESAVPPIPASSPTPPVTPPKVVATSPPNIKPSRTRGEWEALIGGKWLNRIGAFALILGIGFFLKYAFDNNLISETLRVAIGYVIGAALLFGGARWHKKGLAIFAQQRAGETDVSAEISRLKNLQQLTLSGVWLFYSVILMVTGIWRRLQGLRIMAIALFGLAILKIFIYDLSFLERLYRIFSFIGLGVILLLVSYLYQRYKAVIFDSPTQGFSDEHKNLSPGP